MKNWNYYKSFDNANFELDHHDQLQTIDSNGSVELEVLDTEGYIVTIFTTINELREIVNAWDNRRNETTPQTKKG